MKRPTGRALRAPLAGSPACVFAFVFVLVYVYFELIMKVIDDDDFDDDERKKSKKPTLAQTIDQVMTIKTHTESSKTELSSGGKRQFKVWRFFSKLILHQKLFETFTTKLFELKIS